MIQFWGFSLIFSQSVSLTQYVVLCACLPASLPVLSVPVSFWRGFVDNTIVKHCSDIPLIQDIVPSNAGAWLSNATLRFLAWLSSATLKIHISDFDAVKSKFGLLIK